MVPVVLMQLTCLSDNRVNNRVPWELTLPDFWCLCQVFIIDYRVDNNMTTNYHYLCICEEAWLCMEKIQMVDFVMEPFIDPFQEWNGFISDY